MKKHNQVGFSHLIILVIGIALIAAVMVVAYPRLKPSSGQSVNDSKNSNGTAASSTPSNLAYSVYPDSSEAPKLHLYWGKDKMTDIDPSTVVEVERFGQFENIPVPACDTPKDPGAEWAIHFTPGTLPVYAYAPGTVTNVQDEGETGEVVIRFGTSYAVKYLHVANIPSNVTKGAKIEAGALVGYTHLFTDSFSGNGGYEFWELEVNKIIDGKTARTDFPLDYFDDKSKAVFEKLRTAKGMDSWFVDKNNKDAGWLAYTGKTEAWADISKLGVKSAGDDYCQFLRDNKLAE
jgi:hypothetical protein